MASGTLSRTTRTGTGHARHTTLVHFRVAHHVWPATKRTFDLLTAGVMVAALVPVLLAVAILIKLDSRGPVLFRQRRVGRNLQPFTMLKFRTMRVDASPELHRRYIGQLAAGEQDDSELKKLTHDPRVTRVGRLLRRLSLDELPQFVNVITGQMSLIGPRPALYYELEHYRTGDFERFVVRPGLTGLWQVSGRNRMGFHDMLSLDVEYSRTCSPRTDLRVLARTPLAIFRDCA